MTVTNNKVILSNASLISFSATGADIGMGPNVKPVLNELNVSGNEVTIDNVTFSGQMRVAGVSVTAGAVDVSNNRVTLSNVKEQPPIVTNTNSQNIVIFGAQSTGGKAEGNVVEISATDFQRKEVLIYGGKGLAAASNQVIIGENVTTNGGRLQLLDLYGGLETNPGQQLNQDLLALHSPVTTNQFGGVQHFQFYLTEDRVKNNISMLKVEANAVVLEPNQSTITIATSGGYSLSPNTYYTLIESNQGFVDLNGGALTDEALATMKSDSLALVDTVSLVRQNVTTVAKDQYDLTIENGDALVLKVQSDSASGDTPEQGPSTEMTLNPETDVLMQSSIASLASLLAVDDLLMDTALKSRNASRLSGPFVATRIGTWSYDGSSRFDSDVYSGLFGWAFHTAAVEFGPFVEMGRGNYELHQGASGRNNYVGAGVYANWQTPFYLRLTGYLKGGAVENNFQTSLVGEKIDFDNTSAYWGAHLGANIDLNITKNLKARPFVAYFYDGRESDSFNKNSEAEGSARFDFDAIDAHRVQIGSMFEYVYTKTSRPYFGLTYEQVFKAKAQGTAQDADGKLALRSSDIEGASGIISAGWNYLSSSEDFSLNLGVNGYGGARNGVSAQMHANWLF